MKFRWPDEKPDPTREWHEWFAWHPVTAKEAGYYTAGTMKGGEWFVWWQYVLRKKCSTTDLLFYQYEVR